MYNFQVVTSMLLGETAYIKAKVNAKGKKVSDMEFKEKGLKFNVTLKAFDRASDSADLEQDERLDRAQHHKVTRHSISQFLGSFGLSTKELYTIMLCPSCVIVSVGTGICVHPSSPQS